MNIKLEDALSKAVLALYIQGKRSMSEGENSVKLCAYRGDEGACCLFGHMINDEHYSPDLESNRVSDEIVLKALEKSIGYVLTNEEERVIDRMQEDLHDALWGDGFRDSLSFALEHLILEQGYSFASKVSKLIETYNKENNS